MQFDPKKYIKNYKMRQDLNIDITDTYSDTDSLSYINVATHSQVLFMQNYNYILRYHIQNKKNRYVKSKR